MQRASRSASGASLALAGAVVLLGGCAGTGAYFRDAGESPETAPIALRDWPHRETWTGVVFNRRVNPILSPGETPGELAPLVGLLGKIGVASVSAAARW